MKRNTMLLRLVANLQYVPIYTSRWQWVYFDALHHTFLIWRSFIIRLWNQKTISRVYHWICFDEIAWLTNLGIVRLPHPQRLDSMVRHGHRTTKPFICTFWCYSWCCAFEWISFTLKAWQNIHIKIGRRMVEAYIFVYFM